jgi:hypothetical protein
VTDASDSEDSWQGLETVEETQPIAAETQQVFQPVVFEDMEKIRQALMPKPSKIVEDDGFTPYVSKYSKKQKRQQQRLVQSAGPHHTRSKGPPPTFSQ